MQALATILVIILIFRSLIISSSYKSLFTIIII